MKLAFRKLGNGKPRPNGEAGRALFILHGLFGSSDNWQTLAKQFAENFTVYLIDQRNHGRSPHSPEHSYAAMSEDLLELVDSEKLDKVLLLGHSMGGKTAMQFAISHPERVEKMVVVDISPKKYPITNLDIAEALEKVNLNEVTTRKEVESILSQDIKDIGTMQFLLKNLYWDDNQKLAWRFNLEALKANLANVALATPIPPTPLQMPVLFVKGGKADYVFTSDSKLIHEIFANARIETIPEAGHWVHADKPVEFYTLVNSFLLEN
jgi:pimeloyl-ACP methyl ester carboxylesterase